MSVSRGPFLTPGAFYVWSPDPRVRPHEIFSVFKLIILHMRNSRPVAPDYLPAATFVHVTATGCHSTNF